MSVHALKRSVLTTALVLGIAAFTATGPLYADDHGCRTGESCTETEGDCAFLSFGNGEDYCVCDWGAELEATCLCSTGEYPGPCQIEG